MNPAGFASAVVHAVNTQDKPRLTPRQRLREAQHFAKVRNAETTYATQLRKVARHVGDLVRQLVPEDQSSISTLVQTLQRYAELLNPWASATAARMLAEVARRDETAWRRHAQEVGRNLAREIAEAPIGDVLRRLLAEQVNLITSLPLEAAQRVQRLATENVVTGRRYDDLAADIMKTGHVTISRANTIARTETARAASGLTEARARYVGCTHGIWRTARDRDVRPLHKRLEGVVFALDDPPIIGENGERGLPGTIFNCRCFMDPVLPAVIT